MRIIGNEIWFDSTLVGRLEPGISETLRCAVVETLESGSDTTEEWQQACDDAVEIEGLKAEIENLESQIEELTEGVAKPGGVWGAPR